jgi:peroxiredoxin
VITPNEFAPDFEAVDVGGQPIRLSSFNGTKHVALVFNRGLR